jgi:soluble lytic murein transglycosylase-like protein
VVGKNTWLALTGKSRVFKSITDQLWEPRANIEYAAKYLVFLRDYVGEDISLIIAAYNGGHGNPVVVYAQKVNAIRKSYE